MPGSIDVGLHDLELVSAILEAAGARPDHRISWDRLARGRSHQAGTRRQPADCKRAAKFDAISAAGNGSDKSLDVLDADFKQHR
jgi:hypothetical protein